MDHRKEAPGNPPAAHGLVPVRRARETAAGVTLMRRQARLAGLLLLAATGARLMHPRAIARDDAPLRRLAPAELRTTSGELRLSDAWLGEIITPIFRAVASTGPGDAAGLAFVYLGPTEQTSALASGQVR